MKVVMILLSISLLIVVSVLTLSGRRSVSAAEKGVLFYKKESSAFVVSATHLGDVFSNLNIKDSNSVKDALLAFKRCRLQYKRISFFMEYFFPEEAVICNGAPVQEMESQEEFREPAGLQVIESLLCSENPYQYKKALITQANLLVRTVENFSPLLNDFKAEDNDILESFSLELIRIITLYISGFDAPQIKTGIEEAHESLSVISELLDPFIKNYEQKDSIDHYLYAGREYLKTHSDFDSFDRLFFLTRYALPIERLLNRFISETGFTQNPGIAFSFHAKDLFEPDAINKMSFPHREDENDTSVTALGKQLFFEPALSGNNTRSCATCHSPATFFGDGLSRNRSIDGRSDLPRNTPSLLYVCYQYAQFWDGRAESLEDQIRQVLKSRHEMNVSEDTVVKRLSNNVLYAAKFKKIWAKDTAVSVARTAGALAAFIRTLTPFRSSFDRYMQGDRNALTLSQQRGFNVFMGKAQCGTCHFAP
ncbi:MAG TPA: cytochrome-c peroxidase, partial [Flavitalea sp.]|nr:cytochrome-c peroxidase [Flavitalea sp.]